MKFWCLQTSQKANQNLERFLPYESRAEICQKFGWLFGIFEDSNFFILRLTDLYYDSFIDKYYLAISQINGMLHLHWVDLIYRDFNFNLSPYVLLENKQTEQILRKYYIYLDVSTQDYYFQSSFQILYFLK